MSRSDKYNFVPFDPFAMVQRIRVSSTSDLFVQRNTCSNRWPVDRRPKAVDDAVDESGEEAMRMKRKTFTTAGVVFEDPRQLKRIDAVAARRRRSRSAIIREALELLLGNYEASVPNGGEEPRVE